MTDFEKTKQAIERLNIGTWRRVIEISPGKITLACYSFYQSIEFSFDSGKLLHIIIKSYGKLCAQMGWQGETLVGVSASGDDELHFYGTSDKFAKVNTREGFLICK